MTSLPRGIEEDWSFVSIVCLSPHFIIDCERHGSEQIHPRTGSMISRWLHVPYSSYDEKCPLLGYKELIVRRVSITTTNHCPIFITVHAPTYSASIFIRPTLRRRPYTDRTQPVYFNYTSHRFVSGCLCMQHVRSKHHNLIIIITID